MPSASPIILILGAGPKIGQGVAQVFSSKGYKVALAARSLSEQDSTDKQLNIKSDFTNPEDVVRAFTRTKKELGIPSVVVYNASIMTPSPHDDPFAVPIEALKQDTNVNIISVFTAAQQAVKGFAELPAGAAKTFFVTGNVLNVTTLPGFISQGTGKSASAHMMMAAAAAYGDKGYKFYYADERKPEGGPIYKVSGEAHGNLFWELAEAKTQGPWLQTFVKGVGYKDFGPYRLNI